jgi:hypothetical protein
LRRGTHRFGDIDGWRAARLAPVRSGFSALLVVRFVSGASVAGGLAPGDIDYQLSKMTLLGHMRKGLKSLVECKFAIHHRSNPVLFDETIHIFEIVTPYPTNRQFQSTPSVAGGGLGLTACVP